MFVLLVPSPINVQDLVSTCIIKVEDLLFGSSGFDIATLKNSRFELLEYFYFGCFIALFLDGVVHTE